SAKEEASVFVKTASARATQRSVELVNSARSEAATMKLKAEDEIERERRKAAGELKGDIAGIALAIAGKVVEKELDPAAHKALIDSFIDGVGDAS
ncbi:MAG: ATP synthase F0 subunit B, partial [Ruthenibacterium sp.]